MTFKKAYLTLAVTVVSTVVLVVSLGAMLGRLFPVYFRSVFLVPPDQASSTVALGVWLGARQGLIAGLVLGVIVVLPISWYRTWSTRRQNSPPSRMSSRTKVGIVLVLLLIGVLAVPAGFFCLYVAASVGTDRGWPKLAAVWRDTLEKYDSPEEAAPRIPDLEVLRFKDDEWLFGLSQNSHGAWNVGGGTVVFKDSRGEVRIFFGHVCGRHNLTRSEKWWHTKTLDEFYEQLKEQRFEEYHFP